jgi:thiol-disulfide isomerase/thioredoxin
VSARTRWLIIAAAAIVAAMILIPLFHAQSPSVTGPAGMAGQSAPVFDLRDDNGNSASLAHYRGKIVVMNLWASWCPPCRAEMPDLQRVAREYAGEGVVVVGVNQGESADRAATFARSLGITFPIWIDDSQRYGRVYAALGLPTTVVIDRKGVVLRGFDGPLTIQQMRETLAEAVHAS